MKLSTRGRYGVKAMLDLALAYGSGPVPVKEIAERQRLSEHYLEQLVSSLRRAGLIQSVRGAQGGYELSRDPSLISIGDVVRVLEGPISFVDCLDGGHDVGVHCDQSSRCMTRSVWKRLRDSMEQVLNSTTLRDIIDESRDLDLNTGAAGTGLGCPPSQ